MGDNGYFSEKDLIKAIYTAWNIEADLYLLKDGIKKVNECESLHNQAQIVFAPHEENEVNSDFLKKFGYYMEDKGDHRVIIQIDNDKIVRYEWSEVKQLI